MSSSGRGNTLGGGPASGPSTPTSGRPSTPRSGRACDRNNNTSASPSSTPTRYPRSVVTVGPVLMVCTDTDGFRSSPCSFLPTRVGAVHRRRLSMMNRPTKARAGLRVESAGARLPADLTPYRRGCFDQRRLAHAGKRAGRKDGPGYPPARCGVRLHVAVCG